LKEKAQEALKYLHGREKFWRQQNPLYARKSGHSKYKKLLRKVRI